MSVPVPFGVGADRAPWLERVEDEDEGVLPSEELDAAWERLISTFSPDFRPKLETAAQRMAIEGGRPLAHVKSGLIGISRLQGKLPASDGGEDLDTETLFRALIVEATLNMDALDSGARGTATPNSLVPLVRRSSVRKGR